jgi:hypothetical protein
MHKTSFVSVAVAFCSLSLLAADRVLAYEIQVHAKITENAFDLAFPPDTVNDFLARLGINPGQTFSEKTPRQWMIEGAKSEDDLLPPPPRPPYHFFDPISGKGLNGTLLGIPYDFTAAPDWAFNSNGSNATYSIPGARESFYRALTNPDSIVRKKQWVDTFRAIGQIGHLIQDMAQPQHVRNDAHLTFGEGPLADYLFPNYSRFERYTRDRADSLRYEGYPLVKLPAFRKYWTEQSGKGLAQFTNKHFVSQNTNFDKVQGEFGFYADPDFLETFGTEVTLPQVTDYRGNVIRDPNGVPYNDVTVRYIGNNFDDSYDATFSATNTKLATYSFFDFVHAANVGRSVFSLDNAVYDSATNILIPRAVGYTAGLMDYFFRGRLEISLPDEGVYGVVDHNVPAGNTKDTGGFPTIKLKLRNITPAANGVEPMGPGKLIAVAKFHRNDCYLPNLSGEYGSPEINWRTCRSADEEIVVSREVDVAAITAAAQPVTFDFPTRIPINATDLYLQVVYRGQLGEETDAVVVTTKDISEPTYYYAYEVHDQYMYAHYPEVGTGPYTWAQRCEQAGFPSTLECGMNMWPVTTKWQFSSSPAAIPGYDPANPTVPMGTWVDISQQPPLAPVVVFVAPTGRYARVAILTDATPANAEVWVNEWHNSMTNFHQFQWLPGTAVGTRNQRDPATDMLIPSVTYGSARGVYFTASDAAFISSGIQVENPETLPALIPVSSQVCDLAMPNCGQ